MSEKRHCDLCDSVMTVKTGSALPLFAATFEMTAQAITIAYSGDANRHARLPNIFPSASKRHIDLCIDCARRIDAAFVVPGASGVPSPHSLVYDPGAGVLDDGINTLAHPIARESLDVRKVEEITEKQFVAAELTHISAAVIRLRSWMNIPGGSFPFLDESEKVLLRRQLQVMIQYEEILEARMELFK